MSEYNCRVKRVVPKERLITVGYVSTSLLMKCGYLLAGEVALVFTAFRDTSRENWRPWFLNHSQSAIPEEMWDHSKVPEWIDSVIDWIILSALPKIGT